MKIPKKFRGLQVSKLPRKPCAWCERLFVVSRADKRACSPKCSAILYKQANPEKVREHRARNKRKYTLSKMGVTVEQADKVLEQQEHVCAICRSFCQTGRQLAADHNPVTGKFRGYLCVGCNMGLGYFKDDVRYLQEAIDYLCEHK